MVWVFLTRHRLVCARVGRYYHEAMILSAMTTDIEENFNTKIPLSSYYCQYHTNCKACTLKTMKSS